MEPRVTFYRLNRKIVNNQEDIPEEPRQVLYYSLAIGHHVGVMDCFAELMAVPAREFKACLARMPAGEPRRKLDGVLLWDEIEIDRGHVDELLPALHDLLSEPAAVDVHWVKTLIRCLEEMVAEPALYLMVKMRE